MLGRFEDMALRFDGFQTFSLQMKQVVIINRQRFRHRTCPVKCSITNVAHYSERYRQHQPGMVQRGVTQCTTLERRRQFARFGVSVGHRNDGWQEGKRCQGAEHDPPASDDPQFSDAQKLRERRTEKRQRGGYSASDDSTANTARRFQQCGPQAQALMTQFQVLGNDVNREVDPQPNQDCDERNGQDVQMANGQSGVSK